LFREALADGTMEGFFPLIEQFHTQADPAFCGLASLVVALNALGVDPGRLWRGPWRWFSEELLDCCTSLERVRLEGVSLRELACLASCNGASAAVRHADDSDLERLRASVLGAAGSSSDDVVVASYSRATLGQTGAGHFSPLGGYHRARDLVLVLDVARFKYPPHWLPLATLFEAMLAVDPATGKARGWLELQRRGGRSSLALFISCRDGIAIGSTIRELVAASRAALRAANPTSVTQALLVLTDPTLSQRLASGIELREPGTPEHARLFQEFSCALRASQTFRLLEQAGVSGPLELSAAWLLAAPEALWAELSPELAREVQVALGRDALSELLAVELGHVRAQIEFLLQHGRETTDPIRSVDEAVGLVGAP
jgi:glutathione gamma-glutamylcysteinyltransferase